MFSINTLFTNITRILLQYAKYTNYLLKFTNRYLKEQQKVYIDDWSSSYSLQKEQHSH